MGVELKDVHIMFGDTDLAPKDLGSYSSRVTVVAGNACKIATRDAKEQLLNIVADRLEANPDDLDI
jgi:4-hydroxybenzoyl-CoA reductase subunit alpha